LTGAVTLPENPHVTRIHALDGLRGVLALSVVATHFVTIIHPSGWLILSQLPVAAFFVLSGMVLTRAYDGRYRAFLAARFMRLWPVYGLSLAAGYLISGRHPVWLEFLWIPWPGYDGDVVNGPIWSLIIEAWSAPLLPFIAWSGSGPLSRWLLANAVFAFAGAVFSPLLFGLLFTAGARLSSLDVKSRALERPAMLWLGKVSYSLYLTHWLVFRALTTALGPAGAYAGLVLVLPVAWIVWRCVERPSIALSRRVYQAGRLRPDRLSRPTAAQAQASP
jgi:peptidoglycan/LPS O-acetylase OafA/YrhL